jgi:hypothetical protein
MDLRADLVNQTSPSHAKIALFRSLFRGREDVYPRRFESRKTGNAGNNWWVALLTFGERWHNNHHAHPTSARHGLAWYEVDINWLAIRTLQSVGLAEHQASEFRAGVGTR